MFFKIINLIKINYILKKKKLKTKLNKKDFEIIKLFTKLNLIRYVKKNNDYYYIYFKYVGGNTIFYNIKNVYKPSKPSFMNLKEIKKINKKNNNIFLLSTNKGLITNFEAEKNKIGGIVVFLISI